MNAKIAAAISLGASSLALFAMANVANADVVNQNSDNANVEINANHENPNPQEAKANELAREAEKLELETKTEVDKADEAVKNANSKLAKVNEKVEDASKKAAEAIEAKNQAEKDAEDAKKQDAEAKEKVDAAQKRVDETEKNKENAQLVATNAEDAKKQAENTEAQAIDAKKQAETQLEQNQNELQNAQKTVDEAKTNLNEENKNLNAAKENLEKEKSSYTSLVESAKSLEEAKKKADNELKDKETELKEKQAQLEQLKKSDSALSNADLEKVKQIVKEKESVYKQAQEKVTKIKETLTANTQKINKTSEELESKEKELEKIGDYRNLVESYKNLDNLRGKADAAEKVYNAESENDSNTENSLEKKSDFYKFLQYVINTEKAKENNKNEAIIADAERAQKILKGESYVIPRQDFKDGSYKEAQTIEAPTWYEDIVKPGLGRVGSADSLQNMKEAAEYYDALNEYRKNDNNALQNVNVRLSLIAESIVHSFYSAAINNHAVNHEKYDNASVMDTTPYKTAENLAWGDYDGHKNGRMKYSNNDCKVLDDGKTSCLKQIKTQSTEPKPTDNKWNALDGWYTIEKNRYEEARDKGIFYTFNGDTTIENKLSEAGKQFLKDNQYDFGMKLSQNPNTRLFEKNDENGKLTNLFSLSVGHYTTFARKDITAGGFAEGDLYIQEIPKISGGKQETVTKNEDVAVWHGSNESSISVSEYKNLLSNYENSLKQEKADEIASENTDEIAILQKLNAEANKANANLFEAKYNLRKVQYDLNVPDKKSAKGLKEQELEHVKAEKEKANSEAKKYGDPSANWGSEENKTIAEELAQQWQKKYTHLDGKVKTLSSSIDAANAKNSANKTVLDAFINAVYDFDSAKNKLKESQEEFAKLTIEAEKYENEYKVARKNVEEAEKQSQLTGEAKQAKISEFEESVRNLESAKDDLQIKANDAATKFAEANEKVTKQDAAVGNATRLRDSARSKVSEAEKQLKLANKNVEEAEQKVAKAKSQVNKAQKQIEGARQQIDSANRKVIEAQSQVNKAQNEVEKAKDEKQKADSNKENTAKLVSDAAAKTAQAKQKADEAKSAIEQAQRITKEAQIQVESAKQKAENVKIQVLQAKQKVAELHEKVKTLLAGAKNNVIERYNATFAAVNQSFNDLENMFILRFKTLNTVKQSLNESTFTLDESLKKVNSLKLDFRE